ncbi:hypothetical protein EV188_101761 [Actinomycetospora succinea]|uniref:DUF6777 domain-containing protein n=1 Tax=Actinomycetospora succinea TaxID=663603 RepID=A0A4R6VNQ6_9PSEU|nr:DUF6777 domain-containing protein [Actinomycetospora succinea]TDQ65509.1 hypothetical protein EV188_101761 [Actinomycetospora succinea]
MTNTLDGPTEHFSVVPAGGRTRSVPPPGAPPPRRLGTRVAAGVVAAAVVAGVSGVVGGLDPFGTRTSYETVSFAGDDPFTAPVGTDRAGLTSTGPGGRQAGDTPEMYAADPADPSCDAQALLGALRTDPERAAVWAQVQRTTPAELPAFVGSLTPVVLRADTAVVDHGYRAGSDVPRSAVLAAGTAVFVDSYGQPTVKCFSGNPLTPRTSEEAGVTSVVPTAAPIATHTFHHPATGEPVRRPATPDVTGRGPIPVDQDGGTGGGTGGNTSDPVTQGPATPDQPTTPPLTGTFNWDGSITLSDGRVQTADGRIVTLPPLPTGAVPLPDGGYREADGTYRNRDGSPREYVRLSEQGGELVVLAPDGTLLDASGSPIGERQLEGVTVVRGHDGFVTVITDNRRGDDTVVVYHPQGKPINIVTGTVTGGVIRDAAGQVRNPDGTVRKEATLPDGGTVQPDGTTVPAPSTGHGGPTGPHGTPTPTVPIDPPFTPRPTGGTTVPPIDPPFEPRQDRGAGDGAPVTDGGSSSGGTSAGGTSPSSGDG